VDAFFSPPSTSVTVCHRNTVEHKAKAMRKGSFIRSIPSKSSVSQSDNDEMDSMPGNPEGDSTTTTPSPKKKTRKTTTQSHRPSLWEEIGGVLPESQHEELTRFSRVKWKKKTYVMMQDIRNKMKRDRRRAPRKAQEVVTRMQLWYDHQKSLQESEVDDSENTDETNEELLEDDGPLLTFMESTIVQAYNLWIHTLARSGLDGPGYLAEDVMLEMKRHDIPPNVVTYTCILDAHARSAGKGGGAQAAEDFLLRLLKAGTSEESFNTLTFDTILNAWALEGTFGSAEHAEMILHSLEDKHQRDFKPTATSYTTGKHTSTSFGLFFMIDRLSSAFLTWFLFRTVMNAYAKVGSTKAAEKAEALLNRMIRRAEEERNEIKRSRKTKQIVVRPDTIIFNSCINSWATARDPRAGAKSMELLKKMKQFAAIEEYGYDTVPDIVTYNTVLSCWSHCGDENAALQAEKIVKEMRTMSKSSSENKGEAAIVANTVTFNSVLHAWSQSQLNNAASRAEELFEYMIQSGDSVIAPDVYSFNCVIDALSRSKEPHKGRRAREWLDRLHAMYEEAPCPSLKPTQIQYNTVLNACAFSMKAPIKEQREALKIAVHIFASMPEQRIRRDTVTYGTMLKCFANLIPRGDVRNRMAIQVFQECCEEGMVGHLVWNEIRRAVPPKLLQEVCSLSNNAEH
jgi:hypothetical protein